MGRRDERGREGGLKGKEARGRGICVEDGLLVRVSLDGDGDVIGQGGEPTTELLQLLTSLRLVGEYPGER